MEIKGMSMLDQLKSIRGVQDIVPKSSGIGGQENQTPGGKKVSFTEFLQQQFNETNNLGIEAENAIQRSITGQERSPHEAMIAVQKADISLTLLMSLKERIERAYQDIIRTPI